MDKRNRCLDEMTESLQLSLREAVWANASAENRAFARRQAARAVRLRRALMAFAGGSLLFLLAGC
jgi:hypothetical protein